MDTVRSIHFRKAGGDSGGEDQDAGSETQERKMNLNYSLEVEIRGLPDRFDVNS